MSGNTVGLYGAGTSTANIAGGNVTGLYQQTQAVEVDNGYNDADVQAFLESYTGNIQCGNIEVLNSANVNAIYTDGYYYANGTPIDIGVNAYGNANVAAFLPTYTGNLAGGNLILTVSAYVGANITATGSLTTGQNITSGGYIQAAGNIRTTGAAGNITGADYIVSNYFVGDGSLLSNVAGSYSNANVSTYLASGTNTANIITTGNISGSYILGNGSQLTGLPATYSNADVATFLANFGSNTIVTTGNITGGNIKFGANGLINTDPTDFSVFTTANTSAGAFMATGAGTTVVGAHPTEGGLMITGFGSTYEALGWKNRTLNLNAVGSGPGNITGVNTFTASGNITGSNFIGNGQYLTSITGANVTGTVSSATTATTATTATSATTAGTVTTAAQPNITSLGTLSSLTTNGLVTATVSGIKTSNIQDSSGTNTISVDSGTVGIVGNLSVGTGGTGNITTTGILASGNVTLGAVANIHISGGSANYVLKTDGTGNLSWTAQSGGITAQDLLSPFLLMGA
mgnify:CR=1 FL=1